MELEPSFLFINLFLYSSEHKGIRKVKKQDLQRGRWFNSVSRIEINFNALIDA